MLWMERFALSIYLIFIFIAGLILVLFNSYFHWDTQDIFDVLIKIPTIMAFIIWIFFRLVDFLFGGPLRREIKRGQDLIDRSNFH